MCAEMIRVLDEQQSYELLTTTTIGRVGFVHEGRVQILPVNFASSRARDDLTSSHHADGVLGALSSEPLEVAFEVDYHDPPRQHGLERADARLAHAGCRTTRPRATPLACTRGRGDDRSLPLSLHIDTITGRSVKRDQFRGKD